MRDRIDRELDRIEREEGVRVLYAAESGSRAWGFASRDSDWDVRFVYIRPEDWYLTLQPGRDFIELPIEEELDINGWDVKKALVLFRKGNPVLLEWLHSPVPYREATSFAERLRAEGRRCFQPKASLFHYLHMARGNYREFLRRDRVRLKKYLYVLRPLLACAWIRRTNERPPVEFARLVEEEIRDPEVRRIVDDLLERKTAGTELGEAPALPRLNAFLEREMADSAEAAEAAGPGVAPPLAEMDELFRATLREVWN